MRAKTINEVQNFERGAEPKNSMGIGKINEIKNILDEIYGGHQYFEYKIVNPDRIEIFYKKSMKQKFPNEFDNKIWILQYEERERFFVREGKSEISSFTHSFGNKYYWEIIEVKSYISSDPDRNYFKQEQLIDMGMGDKENKEKAEIMAKALNNHYGIVKGFKYIGTEK
jgi:hypothetical protein